MISILFILEILTQIINYQSRKVMTKMDNLFLFLSQKKIIDSIYNNKVNSKSRGFLLSLLSEDTQAIIPLAPIA